MPSLVLVVDDEPDIRLVLSHVLADEGYHVHAAADGQEALDIIERESPDVIITDVRMPRVDGIELVRRLRAGGRDLPIVIVSAHYAAVDLPGVRFVPKPFDLDHIVEAVELSLAGV